MDDPGSKPQDHAGADKHGQLADDVLRLSAGWKESRHAIAFLGLHGRTAVELSARSLIVSRCDRAVSTSSLVLA
jgi:hypothetical protein